MINIWINGFYLLVLLAFSGWMCADVFGLGLFGKILVSLGLCVLVITSLFCGVVLMLQALEHSKVRHINDGKEDVTIVLKLGTFSIRKCVPLQKTGE